MSNKNNFRIGTARFLLFIVVSLASVTAQAFVTRANGAVFGGGVNESYNDCGALTPGTSCAPDATQSTDPQASGSVTAGGYASQASANLATGELRIESTGPTYEATAAASWEEILTFNGVAPGTTSLLGVTITVDGSYRDGSSVQLSIFNQSGDYFGQNIFDLLNADFTYAGNGIAGNPSDPVSGTSFDVNDACGACSSSSSGDWSMLGPSVFQGEITVFGDAPEVILSLALSGQGFVEFGNTVGIELDLEPGVSFVSTSNVFLTPVPVPAALWLFGSALGLLAWGRRPVKGVG